MPDLITSAGSASANSFISSEASDAYLDTRLNASAWSDASDDDKARALIEATRELSLLNWDGKRVDDTQALSWPRQLVKNPDDPNWSYFDSTEIPTRVKDATCELALEFLRAGTTDLASIEDSLSVVEESVGPITTRYAEPLNRVKTLQRFRRVWENVGPLLAHQMGQNQVRLARG